GSTANGGTAGSSSRSAGRFLDAPCMLFSGTAGRTSDAGGDPSRSGVGDMAASSGSQDGPPGAGGTRGAGSAGWGGDGGGAGAVWGVMKVSGSGTLTLVIGAGGTGGNAAVSGGTAGGDGGSGYALIWY